MFQHFRNIETAFKHVRLFSFVLIAATMAICCFCIERSYQMVAAAQNRIYLLSASGGALSATSADRTENIPVEARDHIRSFHTCFFTLDPDEKVIQDGIRKALYLADGSAKKQYDDLKEAGYYNGIISGNISQELEVDSVVVSAGREPLQFRFYGKLRIIRPTAILVRSLVTEGSLRGVHRSDNNPHGFLIERWRILDNRDLSTQNR